MLDLTGSGKIRLNADGRRLEKALRSLSENCAFVGFEGEMTYPDGTKVADVAAKNEFGDSKTPSRPFMRQALQKNQSQMTSFIQDVVNAIVDGSETAESGLDLIGELGEEYIRLSIDEGDFVPNAPSTIARKKSDKPLIDTGLMRSSVTHKTGRKKD